MKKLILRLVLTLSFSSNVFAVENSQDIELSNKGTIELYDILKQLDFTEHGDSIGSQIDLEEVLCNSVNYRADRINVCNLLSLDKALNLSEEFSLKLIQVFKKMGINNYNKMSNKNTIHMRDLSCTAFTPPGPDERIVNCTLKLIK